MEKKFDFVGNEVEIGDEVVFMQIGYRSLKKGRIIKMTDQEVLLEHEQFNVGGTQTKQRYSQIVKIIK